MDLTVELLGVRICGVSPGQLCPGFRLQPPTGLGAAGQACFPQHLLKWDCSYPGSSSKRHEILSLAAQLSPELGGVLALFPLKLLPPEFPMGGLS